MLWRSFRIRRRSSGWRRAVVIEAHDEWQVTRRYVSDVSMDELRTVIVAKERAARNMPRRIVDTELESA